MFLPTTPQEVAERGWDQLDVVLVTGDAYIDSPFIGVAVVGHVLADVGYRVGIIAQPDIHSPEDITRLGEPALFWGVSGGSIDSMVANYTALGKPRRSDDYTPGGRNDRRPDRAVIVYTNLIKRYAGKKVPGTGTTASPSARHQGGRGKKVPGTGTTASPSARHQGGRGKKVPGTGTTASPSARHQGGRGKKVPGTGTTASPSARHRAPIVLGGVEASLRRVAHYDAWDDAVRRSVLLDAKADYLIYGMGEKSVLAFADALRFGHDPRHLRGLCYVDQTPQKGYLELPAYEEVVDSDEAFTEMFHAFYRNSDPRSAQGLTQRYANRYLIHNPPPPYLTQDELDDVYALDFERDAHPYYAEQGEIRALDTIRFAVSTHRGCYGECTFCAIGVHEGRTVRWRSPASIEAEVREIARRPDFKGIIQDVSAPTVNMYGFECPRKLREGACEDRHCLYPNVCPSLGVDHSRHLELLRRLRKVPGVRKVFVSSGLRHDMVLADEEHGGAYLEEVVAHHVSGQMKVAPEHTEAHVLEAMGKPGPEALLDFRERFFEATEEAGLPQFLTYYIIAAHPGCTAGDMQRLREFAVEELGVLPEQVQIFTPTPSTYATLMYHTETNPFTGDPIFVEKGFKGKRRQKRIVTG
jgi:uncharacterized radical SAM protein YgiQ